MERISNNLKIIGIILSLVLVFSCTYIFAGSDNFKLVSSYPKDGQKNTSIENVGVKLQFSGSISSDKTQKINKSKVRIEDEQGKSIPIKVLTADDKSGIVLVLADSTDKNYVVRNNALYTLTIDKDFTSDEGKVLGKETKITFKTFNQKMNNMINMIMMVAMFGGIMFFTMRDKLAKEGGEEGKKEIKESNFNPYKEAKKTGKSVEEVIADYKKKQKKKGKKENSKEEENIRMNLSEYLPYVYHVKKPRPISDAGSNYKSGRGIEKKAIDRPKKKTAKKSGNK